jgi:hypothetical protein
MRYNAWRFLSLFALLSAVAAAGCSNRPRLAEVKGTVKLKGKPLDKIMVEFIPDALNGQRSTGLTDEKGQYTLVCDDKRPGALIGPHRVVLHDVGIYGGKFWGRKLELVGTKDGPKLNPARISVQYEDPSHTPLKKEVKDEPNTIDLELSSP